MDPSLPTQDPRGEAGSPLPRWDLLDPDPLACVFSHLSTQELALACQVLYLATVAM